LATGTTLQLVNLANKLTKQIQAGSSVPGNVTINASSSTASGAIAGTMALNTNIIINISSGSTTISSSISGAGAITKSGNGSLTMSGNDSHSGGYTLNNGTLII